MIRDNQTNFVYLADTLPILYPAFSRELTGILKEFNIPFEFLPGTRDIWARDFMPIQVLENKFIEYRYDPDYLQGIDEEQRDVKTYPDIVCDAIKLKTVKTDIILDGGNVVKSSDTVILTDKIFEENKMHYTPDKLLSGLKELFETDKIVIIPWEKEEKEDYGHSDGMIRFLDDDRVLIQGYFDECEEDFKKVLFDALKQKGLQYEKLVYKVKKQSVLNWAYINFLHTKDLIIVPAMEIEEDEQALEQIKKYFPEYAKRDAIRQIKMREIVKTDGALNCLTWTRKVTN